VNYHQQTHKICKQFAYYEIEWEQQQKKSIAYKQAQFTYTNCNQLTCGNIWGLGVHGFTCVSSTNPRAERQSESERMGEREGDREKVGEWFINITTATTMRSPFNCKCIKINKEMLPGCVFMRTSPGREFTRSCCAGKNFIEIYLGNQTDRQKATNVKQQRQKPFNGIYIYVCRKKKSECWAVVKQGGVATSYRLLVI